MYECSKQIATAFTPLSLSFSAALTTDVSSNLILTLPFAETRSITSKRSRRSTSGLGFI